MSILVPIHTQVVISTKTDNGMRWEARKTVTNLVFRKDDIISEDEDRYALRSFSYTYYVKKEDVKRV